jgi:hypothetical protein
MLSCEHCILTFSNKKDLTDHVKTIHVTPAVFSCTFCPSSFRHKSSLRRHIKQHDKDKKRTAVEVETTQQISTVNDVHMYPSYKKPKVSSNQRSMFKQYEQLRLILCENNSNATFLEWSVNYQNRRGVDDPSLSASSASNILSTHTNHFVTLSLPWKDPMKFYECIDAWMDKRFMDTSLQPITTVNHLRHLKWWALYEFTYSRTDSVVLDWLTDIVASVQSASSKRSNDIPCIAMLDPYQLAILRDKIVMGLQKQQRDIIDPFLEKICRGSPASFSTLYRKECINFGLTHLRCFLDLCMRFLCPPQRMQCTIYQCEPDVTDTRFVCKLSRRSNEYVRIVHRDKTGDTHQPLEVPMGITISTYLTFYRSFCRPDPSRSHTFQTSGGGYWIHASRDVKQYVNDQLKIDPNEIEPNGRFVHGSRHIGLATYALAVQFNSERLREFAHLIRHSVAVSEKYYSVWLERNRNERASKNYRETMGLETEEDNDNSSSTLVYKPLSLRPPSTIIRTQMLRRLQTELGEKIFVESPYALRDASTQTGPENDNQSKIYLSDSCTLPLCKQCEEPFSVLGPLGQSRHRRFGQYFAQCIKCNGRRPHKNTTIWYPIGYQPSCPSLSQIPRNNDVIKHFVTKHQ